MNVSLPTMDTTNNKFLCLMTCSAQYAFSPKYMFKRAVGTMLRNVSKIRQTSWFKIFDRSSVKNSNISFPQDSNNVVGIFREIPTINVGVPSYRYKSANATRLYLNDN